MLTEDLFHARYYAKCFVSFNLHNILYMRNRDLKEPGKSPKIT